MVNSNKKVDPNHMLNQHMSRIESEASSTPGSHDAAVEAAPQAVVDDRPKQEKIEDDNSEDLYSVKNFVV